MSSTDPFERRTAAYDAWYDDNEGAYRAELAALERVCPDDAPARSLAVGVGTGRFAGPLGVSAGLDPARSPLERAARRGVDPVRGVAEALPIADDALAFVLAVTVFSFLDDPKRALGELRRVMAADGTLVAAVLDRSSPVGRIYEQRKHESLFYADAEFVTAKEAAAALADAGFSIDRWCQAIFEPPDEIAVDDDPDVREGHGDGLFAVLRASPVTA